jgi:hypothetical protein
LIIPKLSISRSVIFGGLIARYISNDGKESVLKRGKKEFGVIKVYLKLFPTFPSHSFDTLEVVIIDFLKIRGISIKTIVAILPYFSGY